MGQVKRTPGEVGESPRAERDRKDRPKRQPVSASGEAASTANEGEVLELFTDLLELSEAERIDRLATMESKGSSELVREVRSLLQAHVEVNSSDFLEPAQTPPLSGNALEALVDLPSIEGFRILEKIGSGGMATVYLAEQREPIWRQVAIKVLKHGLVGSDGLARFQLEQQALALMSHPNIAKVLDTGTTEGNRPYFVMEYVPGLSITEHCWRHETTARERLRLFLEVCAAVGHAHQKGIIHRDIKPSNILVSEDESGVSVQVIDFGIAKTTIHHLTQETPHTLYGQLVGTPEYMSPEQIQRDGTKIDTRTDIYSLGVVLYEMLTGEAPFSAPPDTPDPVSEICRAVVQDSPTLPSEAANPSDDSTQRRPRTVPARELRSELDWIILRCLQKDRCYRYSTVRELALDIGRHLNHQAVDAGPPSLTYRVSKFARRHWAITALGSVLLTLGVIVGASTASMLDRKHRESEQSRTIYSELFEHAGSPMMTFDGDTGFMIKANPKTLDVFGYTQEEFLSKTVYDISNEPEETEKAVARILAGELLHIPRRIFKRKDGTTFPAEIFAGKYTWDGKTMGVGVVRPIEDEIADEPSPVDSTTPEGSG